MKRIFQIIRHIFIHIFNLKNMDAITITKAINEFVSGHYKEFNTYFSSPTEMYGGTKASEHVKITRTDDEIAFTALSWDFLITKEINAFSGTCFLKTHRLVYDENDYPKKKMVHFSEMDIVVKFPFSSTDCFRFVEDEIVNQTFGKNPDGTLMTVPTNKAIIHNFPIQYLNKLYSVMKKMQAS